MNGTQQNLKHYKTEAQALTKKGTTTMPNHITTHISIEATPKLIKELLEKTKLKEETSINDNEFDFNGITPMPEELLLTVSPVEVVDTEEEANAINAKYLDSLKEWPEAVRGKQNTRAISRKEHDRRLEVYGANNWYDWSVENWGTKWNSYEVQFIASSPTNLVFVMQTAWAPPHAIFETLEAQGYELHYYWQDEGDDTLHEHGEPENYFETWVERTVEYVGAN